MGMKDIRIGNLNITSDALNTIVQVPSKKKDGTIGFRSVGFYNNLEQASKAIFDRKLNKSDASSVKALLSAIYAAKYEIVEAIKEAQHG